MAGNFPQTREQRLIDMIRALTGESGIGDDCALLPGGLIVTSDALVEGNHFSLDGMTLEDVGWKAIAVNLSDIAAMAGLPRYATVALGLPPDISDREVRRLYQSMADCASLYRTRIVGGDLTACPQLVVSVTVIGEKREGGCLTRCGARPGDVVAVTGDFGASAAGLWALASGRHELRTVIERHRRPLPRLAEAWWLLARAGARGALMDASDGLADALLQIAAASRAGMEIDLSLVPVAGETLAAAALASVEPLDWALYGGEDYELVASVPAPVWDLWSDSQENPFVKIGVVTDSEEIEILNGQALGSRLDLMRTFQHWR